MHVREVGRGGELRQGKWVGGGGEGGLVKYQMNTYEYLRPADSTLTLVPRTLAKRNFARECK